jgi:hypothetical protein
MLAGSRWSDKSVTLIYLAMDRANVAMLNGVKHLTACNTTDV